MDYGQRSDPGRDPDKQVNEDACARIETRFGHLCVVCDGMGGHAAGREAAELALATIVEVFDHSPEGLTPAETLRAAIEEANRRVHVMRTSEIGFGRPGSTAVAVLMHARGTETAHVGDSRAYLVHEGQISRLTRDHSLVQELLDRGLLTAQQAAHHPDANRITRALGMAPEVEVELRRQPTAHVPGDAFVLCSDGLSDLVEDHEILAIVGDEPAAQAVGRLVDLANARGGHDNISVIVLRAREGAITAQTSVAPTVAQTSVTEPIPVVSGATAPPRTLIDPAPSGSPPATAPGPTTASARAGTRSLAPTPVPLAPETPPATRARSRAVVAALALASVAVVLLGGVLMTHFADRSGKRNRASEPLGLLVIDAGDGAPTALSPEKVVLPANNPRTASPIAPLEVPAAEPRKRAR